VGVPPRPSSLIRFRLDAVYPPRASALRMFPPRGYSRESPPLPPPVNSSLPSSWITGSLPSGRVRFSLDRAARAGSHVFFGSLFETRSPPSFFPHPDSLTKGARLMVHFVVESCSSLSGRILSSVHRGAIARLRRVCRPLPLPDHAVTCFPLV